jgi:hypothetical protein
MGCALYLGMTYYESAEGETIGRERAIRECHKHSTNPAEMLAELGDHDTYDAQAVLDWLGY